MRIAFAAFILAWTFAAAGKPGICSPEGQAIFRRIQQTYRAHPSSPYTSYTLQRSELTFDGLPDFEWSYTYRVWYRASDGAALERRTFRGKPGQLEFAHVLFNQACDPGPATADPFNLPPITPRVAATPPPSLRLIASVVAVAAPVYEVTYAQREGDLWHVRVRPLRDPQAYRLRELWADASTFELQKAVVTDKLFLQGGPVYDQLDTLTMSLLQGRVVINHIHTRANFDQSAFGDGLDVDYSFTDIAFPSSLPDWYFDPAVYGTHVREAPV